MNWLLFIGGTWAAVGCALALVIGRSIHLANQEAARTGPDDVTGSAVVPSPAPAPVIERHTLPVAPARRQTPWPISSTRSPLTGGCVSPAERAVSEHEHGAI